MLLLLLHKHPALSRQDEKILFFLSYFCMIKRRVQGGEATSERRRRDGVYQKSYKRAFHPLIYLPLSPRGDRCEHTSPTVRQLLNHGYRFETLKRRLGFAAVPCQAMANLAVGVWVRVWVRTWRDRVILAIYCSNTSSVAVNRATFCPSLGDADRVCFANRSIPHWGRLSFVADSMYHQN